MHLQWLEDFRSLAGTGNFSRSATLRHTTQSAFSRRIRSLEQHVGTELFDRSSYPVKLTHAGRVFRDVADTVVETLTIGCRRTLEAAKHIDDPLVVAATHTMASQFFPPWLQKLEAELGPLRTHLECYQAEKCFDDIESGAAHFALCPIPDAPMERLLQAERLPFCVVGRDVLLPVSTADASGRPVHALPGSKQKPVFLLSLTHGSLLGGAVRRLLAEKLSLAPSVFQTTFESPLKEALKAMALRGQGLAWLPHSLIANELSAGSLVSAGDESWHVGFDIRIYRSPGELPRTGERLWAFLKSARDGQSPAVVQ